MAALLLGSAVVSFTVRLAADESQLDSSESVSAEHVVFFENKVRPLLSQHCWECHGADEASGDLRLDSLTHIRMGGESGAAIVAGEPDESLLIQAVRHDGYEMPPSGKLPDDAIEVLTRWVAIGAPWPGEDPNAPIRKREQFDENDRSWWAIQPVEPTDPPLVKEEFAPWCENEIDAFIVDAMQAKGLKPSPAADPLTLVRRLYLDVTGVPPTPDQVDAFLQNESRDAYQQLVDQLLDSSGYGEHAARQWLDVVRYADSDGYRADDFRPNAYRYRDYVIDSFNNDKPYDRFVQEQIAGDEMFPGDADALVATGFLRHWVYEWNLRDARGQWTTILNDITDTTADAMLGLGLQCAKCHNHKFDPLLQKDYFRLQAFLSPILPVERSIAGPDATAQYESKMDRYRTTTAEIQAKIDAIEKPYREKAANEAIDKFPDDLRAIARANTNQRTPLDEQLAYLVQKQVQYEYDRLDNRISAGDKDKLVALRQQLKRHEALKPKPLPVAMTVTDVRPVAPSTVIPKRSSDDVLPGIPSILDANPMSIEATGSSTGRRTALAKWIASPSNPLSTRVIVNRIWQSHFGRGLAANASDFGTLGGPPSHPELLDWLTHAFIQDGWSLKKLHRRILLSATYRQSTEHPDFESQQVVDPHNEFYWRQDCRRLTAEQIRDSLLTATGRLKRRDGGSGAMGDSPYRTIYTRMKRNSPDPLLESFDLPPFFASNSSRNTTTTPIQSLLMINSDLMLGHGRALASRVRADHADVRSQVVAAWRRVYGRTPIDDEVERSIQFIERQTESLKRQAEKSAGTLIETSKLPYRDGQAVKFAVKGPQLNLSVAADESLNADEFTIETFFQLRSIASTGAVRTLVGRWNGNAKQAGWRFGVTGAGSRRKPQTMVLQMIGPKSQRGTDADRLGEAAIFSDHFIRINTPYYAAAVFRLPKENDSTGDGNLTGTVTFYLKDLSNDDEPLQVATIEHALVGPIENTLPLMIGSVSSQNRQPFDGLIDDVRLVGRAIAENEILHAVEREIDEVRGHWQFEVDPGVLKNSVAGPSSDRPLHLTSRGEAVIDSTPEESALADFCHALLNSNEFLYVH